LVSAYLDEGALSEHDPDAELEDLRERLDRAEDTLRAIYHGDVDALVVRGPGGPQVFTLRGAQEPYRLLVERMNEGALTCSHDGTILYSNRHFADLLGAPLESIVGRGLADFVAERDRPAAEALVADGAKQAVRRELTFVRADDAKIPVLAAAAPLDVDEVAALLLIVTDLTAQKHSEEIAAAERFARSILEQAADAVLVFDLLGRVTQASWAAERLLDRGLVGKNLIDVLPLEANVPEPLGPRLSAKTLMEAVFAGKSSHTVETRIRRADVNDQYFLVSAAPLRESSNRIIGGIITLTDITERKRAEEHQLMLLAELSHRVKNILAIVQSVASQTSAATPSLPAFKVAFEGRLRAIALAHDVLIKTGWTRVELSSLVEETISPYGRERISWSGPNLLLPAPLVLPLTMVLHELCANAAKYGAFAGTQGRLDVIWRFDDDQVCLNWVEATQGGLSVTSMKPGFGTKLISRIVSHDLKGRADLQLRPQGMHCTLTFPLSAVELPPASRTDTAAGKR
jgi:PAS domain S-box-containing protein